MALCTHIHIDSLEPILDFERQHTALRCGRYVTFQMFSVCWISCSWSDFCAVALSWQVMVCSLEEVYWHFRGSSCLHPQIRSI